MSDVAPPEHDPTADARGRVILPRRLRRSPWQELGKRVVAAVAILVGIVLLVYLDRGGYRDGNDPGGTLSLLDAFYYTTVTLSTTGYGDIAPVSDSARLINALVITPARIGFLVLLIGTTLEVLAAQGREAFRIARWRKNVDSHIVMVGYGTKGRSAMEVLVGDGHSTDEMVAVDPDPMAIDAAQADGVAVVAGDATRRAVLRRAGIDRARQVIITTDRDDTNVLTILTVRQLNPRAWVVAAARQQDNVALMRQSGADAVVTSSEAVGRLLGLSSVSPAVGAVMEDLLSYGHGMEMAERPVDPEEIGATPHAVLDQVVAVIRGGVVHRYFEETVATLERGDRLIVVRSGSARGQLPHHRREDDDD